jgi:UDP-N-acetylglucosamine acyltransferase
MFVGADNLRFKRPCVPGDRVYLHARILGERAVSGSSPCTPKSTGSAARPPRFSALTAPHDSPPAIVDPGATLAEGSASALDIHRPGRGNREATAASSHTLSSRGRRVSARARHIYQFSSVGEATPDLKYRNEPTRLMIGERNTIREGVTIHRGTVQDRGETVIGDDNLLMAYAHVGHDSVIGNNTILVNNVALAGHVHIGDWAILSGYTLVHQFCRIGPHSFSGMQTAIGKDVPAYVTVSGSPAEAKTINTEGLRRRGFSDSRRLASCAEPSRFSTART